MSSLLADVTDSYARRARLMPVLLVVLPVGLALAAWFPEERAGWGVLAGLAAAGGLVALFAEVGRDRGKKKERELFQRWSGTPTTRLLRHGDGALNPVTRSRYHRQLAALIPHLALPTADDERADPTAADQVYDSCVHFLRERTRDRARFALVFAENVSYGFRRNLWAMRAAGLTLAVLGTALCAMRVGLDWRGTSTVLPVPAGALLANAALLALWLLRITPAWVRIPADGYAERLLAACDILSPGEAGPAPR